jgi:hypothetical protein
MKKLKKVLYHCDRFQNKECQDYLDFFYVDNANRQRRIYVSLNKGFIKIE